MRTLGWGAKVFSSIAPTILKQKDNLRSTTVLQASTLAEFRASSEGRCGALDRKPFLRIPPFPGASVQYLAEASSTKAELPDIVDEVRRHRVGGTYWAARPQLPQSYVLVSSPCAHIAEAAFPGEQLLVVDLDGPELDPWHMLSQASALVATADDELRVIAALLDVPCHVEDRTTGRLQIDETDAATQLRRALPSAALVNPFTGELMATKDALLLCRFWRDLIDSNRDLSGGLGFAFWKQNSVAPLLWGGSGPFRFMRTAREAPASAAVAVWRAKAAPECIAELESRNVSLVEVEDGFLRSRGLGSDCIPPLSITVDRLGAHFDPSRESELERLLQSGAFDEQLLLRARELRRLIVEAGIGKYESGGVVPDRGAISCRLILVPGQVEDDRAVQSGGCGLVSNADLLRNVRENAPDAYIIYKPHPDVVAGHRRGAIPERLCLEHANEIVSGSPIASLIASADEVHVNTSLTGFEALLRGKPTTTYGVPFYAGWGLTEDLGPVPERRTARRSIDELVAATLLVYPRYLDPVTGLPCPAEVIVERLRTGNLPQTGAIVGVRRFQGMFMRQLRSLVQ